MKLLSILSLTLGTALFSIQCSPPAATNDPAATASAPTASPTVESTDSSTSTSTDTTTSNTGTSTSTVNLPPIENGSAAGVMRAAVGALKSANVGGGGSALRLLDTNGGVSANDPECSVHAEPWDADTDAVMQDSVPHYPGMIFYCAVNSNTPESTESLVGALTMNQSIACDVQNLVQAITGTEEEDFSAYFEEPGDDGIGAQFFSDSEMGTMELTEACWPQGTPDGLTEVSLSNLELTLLDPETEGYQYEMVIEPEGIGEVTIRYFENDVDGIIGFQMWELSEQGTDGAGSDTKITLDFGKGVILVNRIGDRSRSSDSYRTMVRLRVAGEVDENFQFSSIDRGEGFYGISGPGFSPEGGTDYAYSIYTAVGEGDAAKFSRYLRAEVGENNYADLAMHENGAFCDADEVDCNELQDMIERADNGLIAAEKLMERGDAQLDFKQAWQNYMSEGFPMCEPLQDEDTEGDEGALTLDAVPAHTGAMGVCE